MPAQQAAQAGRAARVNERSPLALKCPFPADGKRACAVRTSRFTPFTGTDALPSLTLMTCVAVPSVTVQCRFLPG